MLPKRDSTPGELENAIQGQLKELKMKEAEVNVFAIKNGLVSLPTQEEEKPTEEKKASAKNTGVLV